MFKLKCKDWNPGELQHLPFLITDQANCKSDEYHDQTTKLRSLTSSATNPSCLPSSSSRCNGASRFSALCETISDILLHGAESFHWMIAAIKPKTIVKDKKTTPGRLTSLFALSNFTTLSHALFPCPELCALEQVSPQ